MLTTYFIRPHAALSAFVDNYILSSSGKDIYSFRSCWPASNETNIDFYLGGKPHHEIADNRSATLYGKKNCLVGPSTRPNGIVSFTGRFHTFIIDFKANGISRIFHIPMHEFSNEIFTFRDVLGNRVARLEEQLLHAESLRQMACIADDFLLYFLFKGTQNNIFTDSITAVSNSMTSPVSPLSVKRYADQTNMSLRNFQRRFKEQVGVPLKLYTRVFRFNECLKRKILQPDQSWTSIAYECGYFDQAHLIKDFKAFTGLTPAEFFNPLYPQRIQMMPITRFTPFDFFHYRRQEQGITDRHTDKGYIEGSNKPPEEQFVFISRQTT